MDNWFTIEQIDEGTFAISEYNHWEETHCYLIIGLDRAVLIDTGLGVSNIKKIVSNLTSLPVLVITTHVHWDHIGGHSEFNDIAVFEDEVDWLSGRFPLPLSVVKKNLIYNHCDFPKDFDINKYSVYQKGANYILHDNEIINLGNRILKIIHTPGHSPGHICLYDIECKYLFSGDLIYAGCLDAYYPSTDPQLFWSSVKKLEDLQIERILPGHHKLNIESSLIKEIDNAFEAIYIDGNLKQGKGMFDFEDFQIHL